MTDYDFSTLNDKEFENISIDLISKDKQKRFERFKAGRDGGIDGRFYHANGSQEIIQSKHYLVTGFNGLISSLKKKNDKGVNEVDKVKKLQPLKYIFATSLPLSPLNKKTIKELFTPFIQDDNDIYGQEDLNDILSKNSNIEEKYYKLWISSTTVLNRIMNNAIKSRSEALVEEIKEKSKYYVITDNHNKAIQILENSNVIIIAGEPGIGKTTLAKHMAIFYIEKDFECYDIENSINEAENIFDNDKKQIFYFDDFLGSNYLEALENKKDSHIIKFIERVKRDKTKRFILTSRTNIFNQSILLSDTFRSKNIDEDEFIISIKSLKEIDKAYILYNHIWHSKLEEKYIDEIYKDKRYRDIIDHKNFSPRIIEFITDIIKVKKEDIKSTEYWNYLVKKLDNPQDVWKNTFDKQSDDFIRVIVALSVLNGNQIEEDTLKNAYDTYIKLAGLKNNSTASKDFDSVIEEVVKYFLNRTKIYNKTIEYSLFNPSISDFVINKYKDNKEKLILFYSALSSVKSLIELRSLIASKKIHKHVYDAIVVSIHGDLNVENMSNIDYKIKLFSIYEFINIRNKVDVIKRNQFFQHIIDRQLKFTLIDEFVTVITYIDLEDIRIDNYDFILLMIENAKSDENDINKIIELLKYFNIDDNLVNRELNSLVNEYAKMELDGYISGVSADDVDFKENKDEYYGYSVQDDDIQDCINHGLSEIINNIDSFSGYLIDEKKVVSTIDIESINQRLVEEYVNIDGEEYDHKDVVSSHNVDSIEDLFER